MQRFPESHVTAARVRSVARRQALLQLASVLRTDTGKHPVRRRTSSETAAQRCSRIEANIVEYAYIHHGSSPAIAISAQCSAGVILAYSSAVPHARAAQLLVDEDVCPTHR